MGRSSSGLCLAIVAAGIAAFFVIPGCLNPRPEELPSSQNASVDPGVPRPASETCADNPYLASCGLPDEQSTSNPAGSAPEAAPAPQAPGFNIVGDAGNGTEADAGAVSDSEASSISDAGP